MQKPSTTTRTISVEDFAQPVKSPKEVARQVRAHFMLVGCSLAEAARKLNVYRQVVSVQLRGERYLSKLASESYARTFGFSFNFLRKGKGYLYDDTFLNDTFLDDRYRTDVELKPIVTNHVALTEPTGEPERDRLMKEFYEMQWRNEKLRRETELLKTQTIDVGKLMAFIVYEKGLYTKMTKEELKTVVKNLQEVIELMP
jgi:hypothetical protein